MKEIISIGLSGTGAGVNEQKTPEYLINLQIILRIEKILGSKLPGSQFEAVEIDYGFSERRKICKRARKTNTWVRFLKEGEGRYLLFTPSVKIVDKGTKNLTQSELLAGLAKAEILAEKRAHSFRSMLKKGLIRIKNSVKKKLRSGKEKLKDLKTCNSG